MDTHAIVQTQLTLAYEFYGKSYEQRLNDKKLCVTLWLAVLGFVSTRPALSIAEVAFLTLSPIGMFWFLDGARAVYTRLWGSRILQLEALLVREDVQVPEIQPLLFVSGRAYTFRQKIKSLLVAMFLMESVFAFYLLMAILNAAFLYVYAHGKACHG